MTAARKAHTADGSGFEPVCEQADALSKALFEAVPVSVMLVASATAIAYDSRRPWLSTGWFAVMMVILGGRFVISKRYRSQTEKTAGCARSFLRAALAGAVCTGLGYAFASAFFLSKDADVAIPLMIIFMGASSGTVVQSMSYKPASIVMNVPIILTVAFKMLMIDNQYHIMLFVDILVYLMFLLASASRLEQSFMARLNSTAEALRLAASLETEHAAAKAAADSLYQLANHDSLTGLSNRAAFSRRLQHDFDRAAAHSGCFLLFLIDLDNFKPVNDTMGHGAGDHVLAETGRRLPLGFAAPHFAARLGGDEFAVIVPVAAVPCRETIRALAAAGLAAVNGPFQIEGHTIDISASAGIAVFPGDGANASELLANADLALYAAKKAGKHGWRLFDPSLLEVAKVTRDIDHDFPQALANGDLEIWYQPQITLPDSRLAGLEALVRWNHPRHGWIDPPMIVAAASRTRMPERFMGFVLDQACLKIHALKEAGFDGVTVAVNISPSEFERYALPELVRRSLIAYQIEPGCLELEITEDAFANSETVLAAMADLASMGVRLAIDDFGTGNSSLAYLRTMRVNRIKIDRSFVTGFASRPGDRILVQAILGIGQSFGIDVMAEGVETAEEAMLLQAFGCRAVQGFYFGRPMDAPVLEGWMIDHAVLPALAEAVA